MVQERAQYLKNGCFSLVSVTSSILIAVIAMQQCLTDFVFSTLMLLNVFRDAFSKPWCLEQENIVYSSFKKDNILTLPRESFQANYV